MRDSQDPSRDSRHRITSGVVPPLLRYDGRYCILVHVSSFVVGPFAVTRGGPFLLTRNAEGESNPQILGAFLGSLDLPFTLTGRTVGCDPLSVDCCNPT